MKLALSLSSIALFVALVPGCAPDSDIGDDEEDVTEEGRDEIVGGTTTTAYPAVGALTRFGSTHCTGTVVAPRKVVTAAHCLKGFTASSMKFVLGSRVSAPTAVINVASIQAHPNYNESQLTNDIGVVTLASDAPVTPVKVLGKMDSSWVGRELEFVGFGVNNGFNQTGAGTKRLVKMPISEVAAKQFTYETPSKNTCNGDSGGPAFANVNGELYVAGVTSYGDQNCTQYGVDTRTDTYLSFIGVAGSIPSTNPTQPTDPCQGETFAGRCDGRTVVYCENQTVKRLSCQNACGFSQAKGYYDCQ
jgi:secreted trypsin-like serine protease